MDVEMNILNVIDSKLNIAFNHIHQVNDVNCNMNQKLNIINHNDPHNNQDQNELIDIKPNIQLQNQNKLNAIQKKGFLPNKDQILINNLFCDKNNY